MAFPLTQRNDGLTAEFPHKGTDISQMGFIGFQPAADTGLAGDFSPAIDLEQIAGLPESGSDLLVCQTQLRRQGRDGDRIPRKQDFQHLRCIAFFSCAHKTSCTA